MPESLKGVSPSQDFEKDIYISPSEIATIMWGSGCAKTALERRPHDTASAADKAARKAHWRAQGAGAMVVRLRRRQDRYKSVSGLRRATVPIISSPTYVTLPQRAGRFNSEERRTP